MAKAVVDVLIKQMNKEPVKVNILLKRNSLKRRNRLMIAVIVKYLSIFLRMERKKLSYLVVLLLMLLVILLILVEKLDS